MRRPLKNWTTSHRQRWSPPAGDSEALLQIAENSLYLMQELDQALEQGEPKWTPRQVTAARRLGTALGPNLRELVAKLLDG